MESSQILGATGISGIVALGLYLVYRLLEHHKINIVSGCCRFYYGENSPIVNKNNELITKVDNK